MTQPTSGVEQGEHGAEQEAEHRAAHEAEPGAGVQAEESQERAEERHGVQREAHQAHEAHQDHQDHEEHESHGHSVAAWTAVVVILVGAVVMSLAVVFPSLTWFIVGAVIVVLGIVAGKVLAMAGYGDKASTYQAAHRAGGRAAELPGRQQTDSGTQ